ncbi:MAG: glycosyltransferase, partial [Cyclobacteriaceae bacterium]|nr:glycosyltransferase [Cyclobacteriaceae bacterium]
MDHKKVMKRILFLSSVDFKEKSIQVIRKTPEAYRDAGWEVHYIVGRDESKSGDYFYERVITPDGINVYRFKIPFVKLSDLYISTLWKAIWFRIRIACLVLGLTFKGARLIRKYKFDIIYGYEISGVLAARILRFVGILNGIPLVTRFQGVLHVKEWLKYNERFRSITNFEAIMALKTKADLVIMTNDGSQGTQVLKKLNSPNKNILFITNGVDFPVLNSQREEVVRRDFYQEGIHYFVSISRLDAHKRIDRGLRIIEKLVKVLSIENIKYTIIGGGAEEANLRTTIESLQLQNYVRLLGAINHSDVSYHLSNSAYL